MSGTLAPGGERAYDRVDADDRISSAAGVSRARWRRLLRAGSDRPRRRGVACASRPERACPTREPRRSLVVQAGHLAFAAADARSTRGGESETPEASGARRWSCSGLGRFASAGRAHVLYLKGKTSATEAPRSIRRASRPTPLPCLAGPGQPSAALAPLMIVWPSKWWGLHHGGSPCGARVRRTSPSGSGLRVVSDFGSRFDRARDLACAVEEDAEDFSVVVAAPEQEQRRGWWVPFERHEGHAGVAHFAK